MSTVYLYVGPDEEWRPMHDLRGFDFEGRYEGSSYGRIRNVKTGKILKGTKTRKGGEPQKYVGHSKLRHSGGRTHMLAHWISYHLFVDPAPLPPGYELHHKADQSNNHYSLIEPVTKHENIQHAREGGRIGAQKISREQAILLLGVVRNYPEWTLKQAGETLGTTRGVVFGVVCGGRWHTADAIKSEPLFWPEVLSMRLRYAVGDITIPQLARMYQRSSSVAGNIISGHGWKPASMPPDTVPAPFPPDLPKTPRRVANGFGWKHVLGIHAMRAAGARVEATAAAYRISSRCVYDILAGKYWPLSDCPDGIEPAPPLPPLQDPDVDAGEWPTIWRVVRSTVRPIGYAPADDWAVCVY